MRNFYLNIKPHVDAQIDASHDAMSAEQVGEAFSCLERAHVLGQQVTRLHVRVHWEMLVWGCKQRSIREVTGQLFRLVGAATKTPFGLVPHGNTGGSNVSPFRPMQVPETMERLIAQAKDER